MPLILLFFGFHTFSFFLTRFVSSAWQPPFLHPFTVYTIYHAGILLSILHGKVLEAPELLMGYQQGKAAIQSFIAFISQSTRWQPDALATGGIAAAAPPSGSGAGSTARTPGTNVATELWSFAAVVSEQRRLMTSRNDGRDGCSGAGPPPCCEVFLPAGVIRWSASDNAPPPTAATAPATATASNAASQLEAEDKGAHPGNLLGEPTFGVADDLPPQQQHMTDTRESGCITCTPCIIPAGGLTCIQGDVGTGKSTLLQAILGELRTSAPSGLMFTLPADHGSGPPHGSTSSTPERIARPACAYVPQQAWLMNQSIRDNIVFDSPFAFDLERYTQACDACALTHDFASLPAGDNTSVGDRGENLSGGQRQRVSLARAAYSTAPIVLLDDALSALDPAVATHTFDACILGMMAGRTRVLVSHSALVVECADQVLALSADGELTPTALSPTVLEKYAAADLQGRSSRAAAARVRTPAASLAASGLGGGEITPPSADGAEESKRAPTAPLVMLAQQKVPHGSSAATADTADEDAARARCGSGFLNFVHDFNEGIGGGFWLPFLNVLLFGGECGAVEYGVYKIAVYSEEVEASEVSLRRSAKPARLLGLPGITECGRSALFRPRSRPPAVRLFADMHTRDPSMMTPPPLLRLG